MDGRRGLGNVNSLGGNGGGWVSGGGRSSCGGGSAKTGGGGGAGCDGGDGGSGGKGAGECGTRGDNGIGVGGGGCEGGDGGPGGGGGGDGGGDGGITDGIKFAGGIIVGIVGDGDDWDECGVDGDGDRGTSDIGGSCIGGVDARRGRWYLAAAVDVGDDGDECDRWGSWRVGGFGRDIFIYEAKEMWWCSLCYDDYNDYFIELFYFDWIIISELGSWQEGFCFCFLNTVKWHVIGVMSSIKMNMFAIPVMSLIILRMVLVFVYVVTLIVTCVVLPCGNEGRYCF